MIKSIKKTQFLDTFSALDDLRKKQIQKTALNLKSKINSTLNHTIQKLRPYSVHFFNKINIRKSKIKQRYPTAIMMRQNLNQFQDIFKNCLSNKKLESKINMQNKIKELVENWKIFKHFDRKINWDVERESKQIIKSKADLQMKKELVFRELQSRRQHVLSQIRTIAQKQQQRLDSKQKYYDQRRIKKLIHKKILKQNQKALLESKKSMMFKQYLDFKNVYFKTELKNDYKKEYKFLNKIRKKQNLKFLEQLVTYNYQKKQNDQDDLIKQKQKMMNMYMKVLDTQESLQAKLFQLVYN